MSKSEEEKKTLEAINKLLSKKREMLDDELAALEAIGDMRSTEFELENRRLNDLAAWNDGLKEGALTEESITNNKQEYVELVRLVGEEEAKNLATLGSIDDIKAAINLKLKKGRSYLEDSEKLARKYDQVWDGIAGKIGIGNSKMNKGINSLIKMGTEIKNNKQKQEEFVNSMKRTFSAANLLGSVFESIVGSTVKMILAVDKIQTGFNKVAGAGGAFNEQLAAVSRNSLQFGINAELAGKAFTSLQQGLIGFNDQSPEAVESLTMQVGQLERFGIVSEDAVAMINDLSATMGISAAQSAEMAQSIAMSATELGIGPKKMADSFKSASKVLAVHGKKSVEVFKGLAVAARNAGTSVDSLLSIAGKFDTFSDAADTAGKLNSILGTQMSATEMLMMTEDERLETLIKTVQGQGKAFKDMDRFTQKAIAQAAGISDMAEANRVFGMSLGAYKKQSEESKKAELRQKKFQEAISSTIPIQEKFAEILQRLAANSTVINGALDTMATILNGVAAVLNFLGPGGMTFIAVMTGIGFVVAKGVALFTALGGSLQFFNKTQDKTQKKTNKTGKKIGKTIGDIGKGAAKGAAGFLALGQAILLAGMGFGIAAAGMGVLVSSFKGLGDMAVYALAGLLVFTVGFVAMVFFMTKMAPLTAAAATGLLYFGAAVFVVAGSIALMALSAAELVEKISLLKDMDMIGTVKGLAGIATEIGKIALVIGDMPQQKRIEFRSTLENLALITSGTSSGIGKASSSVKDISGKIENSIKNNIKLVVELHGKKLDAHIASVVHEEIGS